MKTIDSLMIPATVWVNPTHTVQSALILMRGHNLTGLPVLDGTQVVGMLDAAALLNVSPTQLVSEVMITDFLHVTVGSSIKQVADWMFQHRASVLPVIEEGALKGLITVFELLPEIGRSYDPMTGLPWSDTLREWSVRQLSEGREITILFFDLDQFGLFNKRYGHLIGDEVLNLVANRLIQETVPDLDVVCRWGGDEFAIGTIRRREEAGLLAHQLSREIAAIQLEDIDMPVTVSYGYQGGKRTREREQVHFAATVDNLINLASQECLAMKGIPMQSAQLSLPMHAPGMEAVTAVERRVRLQSLSYVREGKRSRAQVYLRLDDTMMHGIAEDDAHSPDLIAQAVLNALARLLPKDLTLNLVQVAQMELSSGRTLTSVVIHWETPHEKKEVVGSALNGEDEYRTVAVAALDALNRPLSALLGGRKQ